MSPARSGRGRERRAEKGRPKSKTPSGALRFLQGLTLGLIVGLLIGWARPYPLLRAILPVRSERLAEADRTLRPEGPPASAAEEKPAESTTEGVLPSSPRMAIIIDDLGQDWEAAKDLLEMDAAITFAVLPHLPHSRKVAEEAHRRGREVLLHLPMEPKEPLAHNPGPGALLSDMDRAVFRETLLKALDSVPHAVGVNNHMGSKLTEIDWAMEQVLTALKERRLFWVDSLTSPRSLGYKMAKKLGIGAARRRFFLDNEPEEEAVRKNIERVADLAVRKGKAIAIGHPHKATRSALQAALPELKAREIRIVPVSQLLD